MRICILGATGLVGRETLELVERAWPSAQLLLFASRDQSMEHAGKKLEVLAAERLEASDAPKGDLALVALDDAFSARYVPRLLDLGYRVVDKSNTYRLDPDTPLVSAGVNCGQVRDDTRLVANPNCTTIPFTMAMVALRDRFGVTQASVSSYQAISGAGVGPLDEFLERSKQGYQAGDRLGASFEASGYAGNTVPHNGKTDDSGFSSEERKLVAESRKILDLPDLGVLAQCCRVPVAVGHYMNVWLTLDKQATAADIESALGDPELAPFVRLLRGPAGEGLSALHCLADRDKALVGRLRPDPRTPNSWCLTVAADNLRLGAATNGVRIASRWFASEDPELQAPGRGG